MAREVTRKVVSPPGHLACGHQSRWGWTSGSSNFLRNRQNPCSLLKFLPRAVGSNKGALPGNSMKVLPPPLPTIWPHGSYL